MSLEAAIHTRWAGDTTLKALLPAARLFTGPAPGDAERPYATLSRLGMKEGARSTHHALEEVALRFDVWSEGLVEGKQILDAIDAEFDGAAFTEGSLDVLRMRKTDHTEERADDGLWRLSVQYRAQTARQTGA